MRILQAALEVRSIVAGTTVRYLRLAVVRTPVTAIGATLANQLFLMPIVDTLQMYLTPLLCCPLRSRLLLLQL